MGFNSTFKVLMCQVKGLYQLTRLHGVSYKVKQSHYRPEQALEGSRRLRAPRFRPYFDGSVDNCDGKKRSVLTYERYDLHMIREVPV
jgi:hypothetical protein